MQLSNPASQLAAMRKRYDKECLVCRDKFEGIKQAKYCSNRCRQIAKRERQNDTANAT